MACSLSSFCRICTSNQAFCRRKLFHYPKIKAQIYGDNGKPTNIVDTNLNVLRERILQVRRRESLLNTGGWNYRHDYDYKHKRAAVISESAEIMGLACAAIGLVFLIGSLFICVVSLFVQM